MPDTSTKAEKAAGRSRAKATSAPRRAAPEAGAPIRRQAVVVVHGQGQQRPMGTIRDFVKVLWQQNEQIADTPEEKARRDRLKAEGRIEELEDGRETWIVPDDKAGLFELQRITTPAYPDNATGRKTDFFELYYADLLNDTPAKNLWLWAQRLLSIRPLDLTQRMVWPWLVFWILSIIVGACAIIVFISIPKLIAADWIAPFFRPGAGLWLWIIALCTIGILARRVVPFLDFMRSGFYSLFLVGGILLSLFVISWQGPYLIAWLASDGTLSGVPIFPFAIILGILVYFALTLLLPLFGDAASYLSAQTETVRSRQAVRERGLRLLRALHDDKEYERIIVVAHSLGTALAYDLLHILWQDVGPTRDNPPKAAALAALVAVDEHTTAVQKRLAAEAGQRAESGQPPAEPHWSADDIATHRELQWAAFDLLRQQPSIEASPAQGEVPAVVARPAGWKVSDFISLGSPLSSAQFLVADGEKDFRRLKRERVLPTSPPQPYELGEGAVHHGDSMHHAAVFGVVRWTNLYDPFHPVLLTFGDVISGPVSGPRTFGEAILDLDVPVRSSMVPVLDRFFTHNFYWVEPDKTGGTTADHIRALRDAVDLYRGIDPVPPMPATRSARLSAKVKA